MAKPLVNLSTLARTIHRLQEKDIKVGIISWLAKNGSEDYNRRVAETKLNYFKTHLLSVVFEKLILFVLKLIAKKTGGTAND